MHRRIFITLLLSLLVTSVAVASGCGGTTVKMTNSGFKPGDLTVKAGTSVTFENTTDSLFVLKFPDKLYGMGAHNTFVYKFNKSSTVEYKLENDYTLVVEVK